MRMINRIEWPPNRPPPHPPLKGRRRRKKCPPGTVKKKPKKTASKISPPPRNPLKETDYPLSSIAILRDNSPKQDPRLQRIKKPDPKRNSRRLGGKRKQKKKYFWVSLSNHLKTFLLFGNGPLNTVQDRSNEIREKLKRVNFILKPTFRGEGRAPPLKPSPWKMLGLLKKVPYSGQNLPFHKHE